MEDTGRVKIDLGECSLKVTRPDGECTKILVSNPAFGRILLQKYQNYGMGGLQFSLHLTGLVY